MHAACDVLGGGRIGVCGRRYHGPLTTAVGSPLAAGRCASRPAPAPGDAAGARATLGAFLDAHADDLRTVVVEPQWGSSRLAQPWDRDVLAWFIDAAQRRGLRVCLDEVMCGLGRHGGDAPLLATAWDLRPDAVVVGKALGGGLFPLAAALVREGAVECEAPLQRHTSSDASAVALSAGVASLRHVAALAPNVRRCARAVREELVPFCAERNIECSGQGLLWGVRWTGSAPELHRQCVARGVMPYFVRGGFMLTPPLDTDPALLRDGLGRLREAMARAGA